MPFYIFDTKRTPIYPEEQNNIEEKEKDKDKDKEISFNWSESFFQIPQSLEEVTETAKETETETEIETEIESKRIESQGASTFFLPETQYSTPTESNLTGFNITADQSVLLPSINSVLESSVRSILNHRQKNIHNKPAYNNNLSNHFDSHNHNSSSSSSPFIQAPVHQRVADKLAYGLPSQNPNSPLLYGNKSGQAADLTEDSLLLALNSSVIIMDNQRGKLDDGEDFVSRQDTKFSLDFLNTPPPLGPPTTTNHNNLDRIPTQVLIQNLSVDSSSVNHEISLLSLNDDDVLVDGRRGANRKQFDPLDIVPDTPTNKNDEEIILDDDSNIMDDSTEDEEEEGHDAILFPDSFDETNNPFLTETPAATTSTHHSILATITEEKENRNDATLDSDSESVETERDDRIDAKRNSNTSKSFGNLSKFEERLMATSTSASPITDFTLKCKKLSNASASKLAPISIKSSTSSVGSLLLSSRSISGEISTAKLNGPALLEPIKKSLGTRIRRNSTLATASAPATNTHSNATSITASPVTPVTKVTDEEKYSNLIMKSGNASRSTTILAEPRKTPIAGIISSGNSNSPFLTPSKAIKTAKEASLASYYSDVLHDTRQMMVDNDSAILSNSTSNSVDNALPSTFKENQWVFFKNGSNVYSVGAVQMRTSKTRDIWRIKQSNGNEFSASANEMCPVAFLRPGDEFFFRSSNKKSGLGESQSRHSSFTSSDNSLLGPFKFRRFSPQNALVIEVIKESSKSISPLDSLKLTRISVERDTFVKIKDRFDHGCIEDLQIRNQIIEISSISSSINNNRAIKPAKKRQIHAISISDSQPATPSKRSTQLFSGMKFLITVGDNKEDAALKEKFAKLIESHGGEMLANLSTDHEVPVLKTFLLSNGFKRTPKFMTAIIRGVPRVHFDWIETCCTQSIFLDPDTGGFLIEPPSGFKPTGLLFKGKKFFISGSSKFKNSWVSVLRLLGGTVSNNCNNINNNNNIPPNGIIRFCENSDGQVGVDWLIRCIVEKTFVNIS